MNTFNQTIESHLNIKENIFMTNNLPVMTLDEFAEKEMARMDEQKRQEEEAKKMKEDSDSDNEEVADRKKYKARDWDDWKDLNDKGSGNKKGR
jgi:immunoglobulin-binding protein 1